MILRWHVLVTQFRHCGCQSRPHHCPSQLEEPDRSWREQPQLSPWLPGGKHSWVHAFLSGQTLEPSSPDKRRQQLPVPGQGFAALNIFFSPQTASYGEEPWAAPCPGGQPVHSCATEPKVWPTAAPCSALSGFIWAWLMGPREYWWHFIYSEEGRSARKDLKDACA